MYKDLMNIHGVSESEEDLYGTPGTAASDSLAMGLYRRKFAEVYATKLQ